MQAHTCNTISQAWRCHTLAHILTVSGGLSQGQQADGESYWLVGGQQTSIHTDKHARGWRETQAGKSKQTGQQTSRRIYGGSGLFVPAG